VTRTERVAATRWILPAVLLMLVLPLYVGLAPWAFDDAYIHLRIADNLAAGEGPYYNPGQVVNASSAPAWTLVLAALSILGSTTLWIACFNAIVTVIGATVFVGLIKDLGNRPPNPVLAWSFALAYCGSIHFSGAGLMETPAALLVLGLAVRLWLRDSALSFLLFSLACFLRPELLIFAVLFLVATSISGRISRVRAWTGAALGALPFVTYVLISFGSLVPHTATAKTQVYALTVVEAWDLLAAFAVPGGTGVIGTAFRWFCIPVCLILLGVGLRSQRASGGARDALPTWLLGAGAGVLVVAYVATRTLVFPWYVPLFVVPGLLFAVSLIQRAQVGWLSAGIILFALVPFATDLVPTAVAVFGDRPQNYRYFAVNARVRKYRELGARLSAAYPGARLLSSEVGGLGDGFDGEILDGAGLISPAALAYHPMDVPSQRQSGLFGSIPAAYVEQVQPELIVSMDVFAQDLLRSDWRKHYRLHREPLYVEADLKTGATAVLWNSTSMNVFVRKDLPPFTP